MTTLAQLFHKHMVSGIVRSNIVQDGGEECYREIPLNEHILFAVVLSILHVYLLFRSRRHLSYYTKQVDPSSFQRRFAILSLLSYIITAYYKIQTEKGLFMLNPCHITVLLQTYLMLSKNTYKNRMIHTAWTAWLFGAYLATFLPHINGINEFQILMYYFEHLAIIPFGYLILNKRYGFLRPNLNNQIPAFCTLAIYQLMVLTPLSRNTMVNLNFTLCHSPADPTFSLFGYYYFVICTFGLNLLSFIARWFSYVQIQIVFRVLSLLGINSPQIVEIDQNTNETPGKLKLK